MSKARDNERNALQRTNFGCKCYFGNDRVMPGVMLKQALVNVHRPSLGFFGLGYTTTGDRTYTRYRYIARESIELRGTTALNSCRYSITFQPFHCAACSCDAHSLSLEFLWSLGATSTHLLAAKRARGCVLLPFSHCWWSFTAPNVSPFHQLLILRPSHLRTSLPLRPRLSYSTHILQVWCSESPEGIGHILFLCGLRPLTSLCLTS